MSQNLGCSTRNLIRGDVELSKCIPYNSLPPGEARTSSGSKRMHTDCQKPMKPPISLVKYTRCSFAIWSPIFELATNGVFFSRSWGRIGTNHAVRISVYIYIVCRNIQNWCFWSFFWFFSFMKQKFGIIIGRSGWTRRRSRRRLCSYGVETHTQSGQITY